MLLRVVTATALVCGFTEIATAGNWPDYYVTEQNRQLGADAAKSARTRAFGNIELPYRADGPYLNWSRPPKESESLRLDENGIPMPLRKGEFQYNPVTTAQFAITAYAASLSGGPKEPVIAGAEQLISLQREDGAFPYAFEHGHHTQRQAFAVGWVSGMAQGQALSAFAYAYLVSGEDKYIDAGEKSLSFLQVPTSQGGTMTDLSSLDPSLTNYIFFEEYVVEPNVYTLNGYMFTLMGLYDWWKITESARAGELFSEGIKSLAKLLPYYDLETHSAYDLAHVTHSQDPRYVPRYATVARAYHAIHIDQLMSLHSVTGEEVLRKWAERWSTYGAEE